MQFINVNFAWIVISSYTWLLIHGIPAVIYLCLNKMIRRDCIAMIRRIKTNNVASSTGSTPGN
jgi:hypothetical protein